MNGFSDAGCHQETWLVIIWGNDWKNTTICELVEVKHQFSPNMTHLCSCLCDFQQVEKKTETQPIMTSCAKQKTVFRGVLMQTLSFSDWNMTLNYSTCHCQLAVQHTLNKPTHRIQQVTFSVCEHNCTHVNMCNDGRDFSQREVVLTVFLWWQASGG